MSPAPLLDWIPQVEPYYARPSHLEPFAVRLEGAARGHPFAFCGAAPPRHGKTETCVVAFSVWLLLQLPRLHIAYVTYGAQLSFQKSRLALDLARRVGLELGFTQTAPLWTTREGGAFKAMGIDGPFTGTGADVLLVDDPHKDRAAAESQLQRDNVWEWWQSTAMSRLEPGASKAVFMQRWHPDDLVGRLTKDGSMEYVNLPAIREVEEP